MVALICFSFAVFVVGRLWALGRHLNEGACDAALLWWQPTPSQRVAHAIHAVMAQNRKVSFTCWCPLQERTPLPFA